MLIYLEYFILNLFGIIFYIFNKKKYSKYVLFLSVFLAIYISAFRDVCIPNTDFYVYKQNYYGLNDNTMDIGYSFITSFFHSFGIEFNIFLFIFIFFSLLIKIVGFKKILYHWELISFFYLVGMFVSKEMATLRMAFAMGLVIFSTYFIIKKQFFNYLITLLIASLFHKSALLLIPLYYIARLQIGFYKSILLLIISLTISKSGFIDYLIENIININYLAGSYLWIKLKTFSNYNDGTTVGLILPVIIKKILIIFISFYTLVKYKKTQEFFHVQIFYNLTLLGILLLFTFGDSIVWAAGSRMSSYFNIYELIMLSYFVMFFKKLYVRLFATYFVLVLIASKFFVQIYKYYDLYIPYHTIFEKWI